MESMKNLNNMKKTSLILTTVCCLTLSSLIACAENSIYSESVEEAATPSIQKQSFWSNFRGRWSRGNKIVLPSTTKDQSEIPDIKL